jgi:transcriptional regulator with GAF, ATPase, and Fis domain
MAKRWKRLMNPDYIGAYILDPGQEMTLTIDRVVSEKIKGEKGKIDIKPVIYFKEQIKPMILNNTNCMTIEFLTGSDLPDDWAGHKITIYGTPVKMGNETVEALRIRATKPELKKDPQTTHKDQLSRIAKYVGDNREIWEKIINESGLATSLKQLNTDMEATQKVFDDLRSIQNKVESHISGVGILNE